MPTPRLHHEEISLDFWGEALSEIGVQRPMPQMWTPEGQSHLPWIDATLTETPVEDQTDLAKHIHT